MHVERLGLYMTLFTGETWCSIQKMPVITFTNLLDWRVKYEEEKQKRMNEEVEKHKVAQKQQMSNKPSSSKLSKYK